MKTNRKDHPARADKSANTFPHTTRTPDSARPTIQPPKTRCNICRILSRFSPILTENRHFPAMSQIRTPTKPARQNVTIHRNSLQRLIPRPPEAARPMAGNKAKQVQPGASQQARQGRGGGERGGERRGLTRGPLGAEGPGVAKGSTHTAASRFRLAAGGLAALPDLSLWALRVGRCGRY